MGSTQQQKQASKSPPTTSQMKAPKREVERNQKRKTRRQKDKRPNPCKTQEKTSPYSHLPWPYVTKPSKTPGTTISEPVRVTTMEQDSGTKKIYKSHKTNKKI